MLQRYKDRHHGLLALGLVNIGAVLVMQGEHLLRNSRDDPAVLIVELEVQSQDIPSELPAQALDIGDVLDDVEQLVGELKCCPVIHRHEMSLVEREKLPLNMRHVATGSVSHIRLIMNGRERGLRAVNDVSHIVRDLNFVMEREDRCGSEQRAYRLSELFDIVDVRRLSGFAEAVE